MSGVSSPERNARMRAHQRDAGAVIWEITRATFGSSELASKLLLGWEPFAVDGQTLYFRRQTVAAST
jgi:hypothetical protein